MIYLKITVTNPQALKRPIWTDSPLADDQQLKQSFITKFTQAPGFIRRDLLKLETRTFFTSNAHLLTFVKDNKDLINRVIVRAREYYAVDGCGVRVALVTEVGGQELEHLVTNLETWI